MPNSIRLVKSEDAMATGLPSTAESHVRAVDVHMQYMLGKNLVRALNGVSIDLGRGEYVALCGSSGSGKSTLLNLIGCIGVPTKGEIHIAGREINQMTDYELAQFRARKLGFVFQTFNLLSVLSAVENVEYPLLKSGMNREDMRKTALGALDQVGLGKFGHHRPDQLSGGQRQRVAIARAFVHKPELIIADEPTANLDKTTANEILDLIGQINREFGVTVIVATHDPLVMSKTRRIIQISDGLIE